MTVPRGLVKGPFNTIHFPPCAGETRSGALVIDRHDKDHNQEEGGKCELFHRHFPTHIDFPLLFVKLIFLPLFSLHSYMLPSFFSVTINLNQTHLSVIAWT